LRLGLSPIPLSIKNNPISRGLLSERIAKYKDYSVVSAGICSGTKATWVNLLQTSLHQSQFEKPVITVYNSFLNTEKIAEL